MYKMIIEQTIKYSKRMFYDPDTKKFISTDYDSLMYSRNVRMPYGWIKESGTPPEPHWDVFLVCDDKNIDLGDEIPIKIIGVFIRNDGDHKLVAVNLNSDIIEFAQLSEDDKCELLRLYPRIDKGEGWFGRDVAMDTMLNCDKPL